MKKIQKDKPPFIYVENSDSVSQMTDEIKFSVENDFEEIINLKDCDGDLTISRKRKFDGAERYGGRKNYSVYEVVTDLNGNFKVIEIIDFEKIPIATKEKLGYIIVGENLDIDVEGKISLQKDFKLPNMTEMEDGKLKNIFENWRNGNAN